MKHFLTLKGLTKKDLIKIIKKAVLIKKFPWRYSRSLKNKTLLMLFAKPSLRTRLSFETGMTQLGGHAIFYSINDSPLGEKETIYDTAAVASKYVDIIMARLYEHSDIEALACKSSVPVINALTNFSHPCQILGDLLTIIEKKGRPDNLKLVYAGDSNNNVTHSLMYGTSIMGIEMIVCCPKNKKFMPNPEVIKETQVKVVHNISDAFKGADIVYTDSWMSYHIPKHHKKLRMKILRHYQVTYSMMSKAKKDAIFMHCLPAQRGMEVTAEVIDGKQSVVIDQAENRLHVQKALMIWLLDNLKR